MIEILTVGVPVDHCADKAEFADRAFEFSGSRRGILHRKMREAQSGPAAS